LISFIITRGDGMLRWCLLVTAQLTQYGIKLLSKVSQALA